MTKDTPIVVHSHLRWSGVWQRPQQILSRLAEHYRIAFVEEPVFDDGQQPNMRVEECGGVTVFQPCVPAQREHLPSVSVENQRLILDLLRPLLQTHGYTGGVRWHYAPMALYLRDASESSTVVYDCMDELSAFKGAPPELVDRERELMAEADLVFTGGASMFENKRQHHPNCYRFDSGVDVEHFRQATLAETAVPDDIAELTHPVIGYYGVIDERMDYDAIRALSSAFPHGSILLVGPVTKVDPAELPRAANIHYTGQRSYGELPGYLKAFDVALVPFAVSPATRYLSPTKTLEYFAGEKPVVSSCIKDVVDNYSSIVRLARSPQDYVDGVAACLEEQDAERRRRGVLAAEARTWDAIVSEMRELLETALERSRSV